LVLEDLRKFKFQIPFSLSLRGKYWPLESSRTYYTGTLLYRVHGTRSLRVGQDTEQKLSDRSGVCSCCRGWRRYYLLRESKGDNEHKKVMFIEIT
jgi:hypothetical protein